MKPYFEDDAVTIYHGDCRDILPSLPKVDLVLTDPPYGIKENAHRVASRGKLAKTRDYGNFDWDLEVIDWPTMEQIIKHGDRAIIFGGNYYPMPPSRCWLVWDKDNGSNDFADCELAWTNLPQSVRRKIYRWNGMLQEPGRPHEDRAHPAQKPLQVITWCISLADKHGINDLILDPFMGSGTILRAAKDLGRRAIGIDEKEQYCEIAAKRMSQGVLL